MTKLNCNLTNLEKSTKLVETKCKQSKVEIVAVVLSALSCVCVCRLESKQTVGLIASLTLLVSSFKFTPAPVFLFFVDFYFIFASSTGSSCNNVSQ